MRSYRITFYLADYSGQYVRRWTESQHITCENPTQWAKEHHRQDSDYLYATTIVEV